ncbi:hypothetical protein D3C72_1318430 [compost metagenome]
MNEDPPNIVLSEKRGRMPRYSDIRITHQGDVRLEVMMPSISCIFKPLAATARCAACAMISCSLRPPQSPSPAMPVPRTAIAPR